MKHSPWRCKKNAIRRIDARNIAKRADQWHRDMDAYIASQTRRIGASTVRRRDSDTIDISFTIVDLEPLMTEQYEPKETPLSRMLRKLPAGMLREVYPVGDLLVINGHVVVQKWLEAAADDLSEEEVIRRFGTYRIPDPVELAYPHITPRLGNPETQEELKALFFDREVKDHDYLGAWSGGEK